MAIVSELNHGLLEEFSRHLPWLLLNLALIAGGVLTYCKVPAGWLATVSIACLKTIVSATTPLIYFGGGGSFRIFGIAISHRADVAFFTVQTLAFLAASLYGGHVRRYLRPTGALESSLSPNANAK